uniref:Glycosyl transferase, group 1 n=1 Tax=mine drainage metagenome TaxID=410659 RepID=E6PN38_9ZZZZ
MTRIAVVHDWLVTYAGAERVLEQILLLYPDADFFCVCDFLADTDRGFLGGRQPVTTFIQNLPGARKRYRNYLPLMPLAIEQLDVSDYDLIISSSHAVAKGVLTGPDQLHISYVYSPIRYAWDLQHQYLRESGLSRGLKGWFAKCLLHKIRLWDVRTSNGVDHFIADSKFIARRIWKIYRREAAVIYPPVDMNAFSVREQKEAFYLTASRMVPYKRIDLIVEAFKGMPDKHLKVIGDGPDFAKIQASARGFSNIELLGYIASQEMAEYMALASAFIFAAEEDFGITPVEAQACGTPVIAFGKGGSLETVRGLGRCEAKPTGLFFYEQTASSIIDAVQRFEQSNDLITAEACRVHAETFAIERFKTEFKQFVDQAWSNFHLARAA